MLCCLSKEQPGQCRIYGSYFVTSLVPPCMTKYHHVFLFSSLRRPDNFFLWNRNIEWLDPVCVKWRNMSPILLWTPTSHFLSFIILYHNFKAFATVSLRVKEEGNQDIIGFNSKMPMSVQPTSSRRASRTAFWHGLQTNHHGLPHTTCPSKKTILNYYVTAAFHVNMFSV